MKHFLLARYQLADDAFSLREIRGIAQEAAVRGHQLTLLTHEAPSSCALPAGLNIQKIPGGRRSFARAFHALCGSGEFACSLALDPLPGADFCLPDNLPLCATSTCRKSWNPFSERYFQYKQEERLYRTPTATLIFCSSELQKLSLRMHYGVLPQRLHTLPPRLDDMASLAISSDAQVKFRQLLRCEEDALLVLYFVTPHAETEIRRCLNALAILPETLRDRCRFLAVGELGDSGLEVLRRIAQEARFPIGQLRFLPKTDDRILLLQTASLLLQPSDDDFCGNDLIDALACRLPVICTAGSGHSPFVQTSGCPVVPVPFDQEIFQEALAFTLPKVELLRKMLENRAKKLTPQSRAAAILDHLEKFSRQDSSTLFSDLELQEIIVRHLEQTDSKSALKSDRKRDISRVTLPGKSPVIVKEFKELHFWDGDRHLRRCQKGTALLRFLTPQCLASATHPSTQSSFLLFRDCGTGNFCKNDYFDKSDLKSLYAACGALLAYLHTAGIYHKDTKPANFVLNENCQDECPHPVCLVDCDNVLRTPLPLPRYCRIHNLAQFIAGTGKLARTDQARWLLLIRAFQEGYNRNSLLSQPQLKELWNDFWKFLAAGKHVEYNLPFSCGSGDLQILRKSLH